MASDLILTLVNYNSSNKGKAVLDAKFMFFLVIRFYAMRYVGYCVQYSGTILVSH